jgi:hypothetical protein
MVPYTGGTPRIINDVMGIRAMGRYSNWSIIRAILRM